MKLALAYPPKSRNKSRQWANPDTSELETEAPVSTENQETTGYEAGVELEILPPIDTMKMMKIVTHLDSLPEVEKTEIIALTDNPLIEIFLCKPIDLIDVLRTLPEVERVEEITDGEDNVTADVAHAESKLMKIQITLSGKSVLDETKERLNSKLSRILSL